MEFSIHFIEASRVSQQVSDLVHTHNIGEAYCQLSVEAPRRPTYEVSKHKVSRRLPPCRTHGNTVSVTNVEIGQERHLEF